MTYFDEKRCSGFPPYKSKEAAKNEMMICENEPLSLLYLFEANNYFIIII